MMDVASISNDELRELAGFRAARGAVVSLFLGADPTHPSTRAELESRLRSLVARGKQEARAYAVELDHQGRVAVEADLAHAADELGTSLGARGVGCFADTPDGLWRPAVAFGAAEDLVKVGRAPYLLPLLEGEAVVALVAMVSRERGEIYRLLGGRLEQLHDLSQRQPRRHRDAQAWQQVKLERRIDERARDHLTRVASELSRLVCGSPVPLVLAGEQEHTSALVAMLSRSARAGLVDTVRAESHAGPAELLPLVLPLLEARSRDERAGVVRRWRSELDRGERAVQGWEDTLAAAAAGRIEQLLVAGKVSGTARRCPSCGDINVEGSVCPFDGAPLELEPDALDLAVRLTVLGDGTVARVEAADGFDALDGVGALLRFGA